MLIRTQKQKEVYKLLFLLVKYLPPLSTIMLLIHIILCLKGVNDIFLDTLFGSSIPRALLFSVASFAFGFCKIHRFCVLYNLIITVLIAINDTWKFNTELLFDIELILLVAGGIIIYLLATNWRIFLNCNGNVKATYKWTLRENQQ